MSRELPPNFPKLDKETRPWVCKKGVADCTRKAPCPSCRGRRNRRSGMRKQREARKAIEALTGKEAARFAGQLGNEEAWHGLPLRVEVKSGAQATPVWTRYAAAEAQSAATKAVGDLRPFAFIAVAPRREPLMVIPVSECLRVLEAIVSGVDL